MIAAGLGLTVAGLLYYGRLMASPEFVAVRGANTLFEDPASVKDLPLQQDELRMLGVTPEQGAAALAQLRQKFLPQARIVSKGSYLDQKGKDALRFQVEVKPGVVVETSLPVINDAGRGVIQFGDLVMVYRKLIWNSEGRDAGKQHERLDEASRMLAEAGIKGYYDIYSNEVQTWPAHAEPTDVAAL